MQFQEIKNNKQVSGAELSKKRSSLLAANLSRQTFLMLMGAEIAVLALIGYFFFVKGANKELNLVKAELLAKQSEFSALNFKLDNFSVINSLYKKIDNGSLEKIDGVLPEKANLPDLIVNLDSISKNNGFSLTGVDLQIVDEKGKEILKASNLNTSNLDTIGEAGDAGAFAPTENATVEPVKTLKTINISLNIDGSGYGGLKNLIAQLENNLRLFDVLKFSFSPDSKDFKIDLKGYYF
jgi:Tfp pilus assembly protein PilO